MSRLILNFRQPYGFGFVSKSSFRKPSGHFFVESLDNKIMSNLCTICQIRWTIFHIYQGLKGRRPVQHHIIARSEQHRELDDATSLGTEGTAQQVTLDFLGQEWTRTVFRQARPMRDTAKNN